MNQVLTENKQAGYKSRILEASVKTDKKRKTVSINTDAVHDQIEKQMRKRFMIHIKPSTIPAYVENQVKVQKERENRKMEIEVQK